MNYIAYTRKLANFKFLIGKSKLNMNRVGQEKIINNKNWHIVTFSQQQRFKTKTFFSRKRKLAFHYIEKVQKLRPRLVNLHVFNNLWGVCVCVFVFVLLRPRLVTQLFLGFVLTNQGLAEVAVQVIKPGHNGETGS